jgi:RNA methyltransferase, TrmH family
MLSKSQVKYIQSLGHKKFRDEEGVFIAEGPKIVKELITEIPGLIKEVFTVKDWVHENQTLLIQTAYTEIEEGDLERISQLSAPNKVLAVVKKIDYSPIDTKDKITLVLDTMQDPGNLGTIIRTADWFGIHQVVCSNDCADIYNPKVVQATMGSIARVTVMYTDLQPWLQQQNVKIYATALAGKDIRNINKITAGIFIIGNESKGIHPDLLQLAHEKITITKSGKAESLNAAVATGIILANIQSY